MPILGYLIVFNDYFTENIGFNNLTNSVNTNFFLNSGDRLRYIYFGMMALAINSAYFYLRRPFVIKQGNSSSRYVDFALKNFVVQTFVELHHNIREYGHSSQYGKYYDDDWEAFLEDARWAESGRTSGSSSEAAKRESRQHVNFSEAKKIHEDLVRSILLDSFIGGASKNLIALSACIAWATLGYFLLVIPSIDLFFRVVQVSFF